MMRIGGASYTAGHGLFRANTYNAVLAADLKIDRSSVKPGRPWIVEIGTFHQERKFLTNRRDVSCRWITRRWNGVVAETLINGKAVRRNHQKVAAEGSIS
jgi:hypothetical protein